MIVFIKNALSPAQVQRVIITDADKRQALAIVDESQFSLAIGRQGQNVRLANRLCDWNIDVKTIEQAEELDLSSFNTVQNARNLFNDEAVEEISKISELPGVDAEVAETSDPASFLDENPIRRQVAKVLDQLSVKLKVEKAKVALLLYATALDISITEPIVLEGLGTGKSRAYAVRDRVMKALEKELKKVEGADDPLFGRILLETCEGGLSPVVRTQLGGAA